MCVRALSSSDGKSISSPQAPIQVLFTLAASCSPQPEKAIDSCVTVSSGANMGPPLHTVLILLTSELLYSGLCYQAGVPPIQIKNMRQYNGYRNINYKNGLWTAGLWETWLRVEKCSCLKVMKMSFLNQYLLFRKQLVMKSHLWSGIIKLLKTLKSYAKVSRSISLMVLDKIQDCLHCKAGFVLVRKTALQSSIHYPSINVIM